MEKVCKIKKIYFYNGLTLYKSCLKIINISYNDVIRSIRYYLKKHSNKYCLNNIDELINFLVDKYIKLNLRRKQRIIINDLINGEKINLKYASSILNINYKKIFDVMKYDYNSNQSMLIIYFMGDIQSQYKSISKQKIMLISNNGYKFSTKCVSDLVCFYYLTKLDFIYDRIIDIYSKKFKNWIYKVSRMFYIRLKCYDVEDIMIELYCKLALLLKNNRIVMNNDAQINSFLYKSLFKIIYDSISSIKLLSFDLHLEDKISDDLCLVDVLEG